MSKFKVGNKVTGVNLNQCMYGKKARVIKIVNFCGMTGYILDEFPVIKWWEDELKLIEPATEEFTFEEVIARIKEGEVYETTSNLFRAKKIMRNGWISIEFDGDSNKLGFPGKYRLVPQKKEYHFMKWNTKRMERDTYSEVI
jgi:hypothetical protein